MAWLSSKDRVELRARTQEWLAGRHHPTDPLTRPVELLLAMFLSATSPRGLIYPVILTVIILAAMCGSVTGGVLWILHRNAPVTVVVRQDEQPALQQWNAQGEMSRLMRCDSNGLVFENGRCRPDASVSWSIPSLAEQTLVAEGHIHVPQPTASSTHHSKRQNGSVVSPWQ